MQPKSQRRVHGAEFKAQVLAECRRPGASVAAVALSRGLNVNLVRKWLVGRGLKRAGLDAPRTVTHASSSRRAPLAPALPFVPFVPVALAAAATEVTSRGAPCEAPRTAEPFIDVELRRGNMQLTVRWPASHAEACAAWLHELTGTGQPR
jgi:transposase